MRKRRVFLFVLLVASAIHAADPPPQVPRSESGPGTWTYGPFGYDAAGNIITIGSHYFIYDSNGRLTKASVDRPNATGSSTDTQIHEFTYDEFGNMITGPNPSTSLATDPATNRLTALGAAYDVAGNLVRWTPAGTTINYAYSYDALGALTEVKVNNETKRLHVYTADGERLWTFDFPTQTSHWTIRDLGGKVLRDYYDNGAGNTTAWSVARDYFYRDGLLLAEVTPTATHHLSLDHLGTPRVVTNDAGRRVGFHHYFPFGKEWINPDDPPGDGGVMKFTGHERDRDPAGQTYDVDYMHARYYAAVPGRFLSVDRHLDADASTALPLLWNRYAYGVNSPLVYTDPDGNAAAVAVGAGVGLIVLTGAVVWHAHNMNTNPDYRRAAIQMTADMFYLLSKKSGRQLSDEFAGWSTEDLLEALKTATGPYRLKILNELKARGIRNQGKARGGKREPKKPRQDPNKSGFEFGNTGDWFNDLMAGNAPADTFDPNVWFLPVEAWEPTWSEYDAERLSRWMMRRH